MDYGSCVNERGISKEKINISILTYLVQEGFECAARSFAKEINVDLTGDHTEHHSLRGQANSLLQFLNGSSNSCDEAIRDIVLRHGNPQYENQPWMSTINESNTKSKIVNEFSTINQRKEIKFLISKGMIDDAIKKITKYFPTVLDSNNLLHFTLLRLNVIEMIRSHKLNDESDSQMEKVFLDKILTFVRENLISKVTHSNKLLQDLEITMSLLCFNFDTRKPVDQQDDLPEELKSLFDLSMRNKCFKLVNHAILNLRDDEDFTRRTKYGLDIDLDCTNKYGNNHVGNIHRSSDYIELDVSDLNSRSQKMDLELCLIDGEHDLTYDPNLSYEENIVLLLKSESRNSGPEESPLTTIQDLTLQSTLEKTRLLWDVIEQRITSYYSVNGDTELYSHDNSV